MIRQKGFTLIEVLAAFMVFSLVFAVAMQLTTVSIKNVALTKDYNQAAFWAQTKFSEIRQRQIFEKGSESGRFNERFNWQLDISPYAPHWPLLENNDDVFASSEEDIDSPFELLRLHLVILWENGKNKTSFTTIVVRKNLTNGMSQIPR
ncbi:MAG: general secretion pathway protein I [Candidatus Endobugula sp.]|jgi:general secretion pathway protein I